MSGVSHPVTRSVYVVVLDKDDPSPLRRRATKRNDDGDKDSREACGRQAPDKPARESEGKAEGDKPRRACGR